jgi:hypothetical protein
MDFCTEKEHFIKYTYFWNKGELFASGSFEIENKLVSFTISRLKCLSENLLIKEDFVWILIKHDHVCGNSILELLNSFMRAFYNIKFVEYFRSNKSYLQQVLLEKTCLKHDIKPKMLQTFEQTIKMSDSFAKHPKTV